MEKLKSILVAALLFSVLTVSGGLPDYGPPYKPLVRPALSGTLTGRVTADKSRTNAVRFTVTLYDSGWAEAAVKTIDNWFPISGDYVEYSFDGLSPGSYVVQARASVMDSDFWTPLYGLLTRHPWWPEYYPDSFTQAGGSRVVVAGGGTTANIDLVLDPVSYILMGTNPPGQPFEVDGVVHTASPAFFEWRRGDVHALGAEEYYENPNGTRCRFREWRQGGSRIQDYTVPPGRLQTAQGVVVDTLIARFDYYYFLDIISAHGNPRGAGWGMAWRDTLIGVDSTVVEKIPPHAFPAKALNAAEPDSVRYVFEHWEGSGAGSYSGTDNPAAVTMNFTVTEKAYWKTQFRLAVLVSDTSMGTVNVNPPGLWQDRGDTVALRAVPRPGFAFSGWEGSLFGTAETGSVVMDTTKSVIAKFVMKDNPPSPFDLVWPPADFTLADSTAELKFVWGTSRNRDAANGDTIRYAFCFGKEGAGLDTLSKTADTSFVRPGLPANGDYRWKVLAVDRAGNAVWSVSERTLRVAIQSGLEERRRIPLAYGLSRNYPNPFNPLTEIGYSLPEKSRVRIEVYSTTGGRIRTLVDRDLVAGEYTAVWDGADDSGRRVGSGIFICRMTAGRFAKSIKMTVMK